MDIRPLNSAVRVNPAAEMDRLGNEIAELSAHLEAATARLLDRIREFDARGGWGNGFRSSAHWLSWRVGLECATMRRAGSWKWERGRGRFRRRCGARSTTATRAAASRGADCHWARGITCVTGPLGAPRRSRTSRSCVAGTIAPSTRTATSWRERPMARSTSGGPTAGCSPRSRPRRQCPLIRSPSFAPSMRRRGSGSTRARRARAGWGSGWMWAGRSTCCIPWPRARQPCVDHRWIERRASDLCTSRG
jgi:hypothetical protein